MATYRVYCDGREFGIDYGRAEAIASASAYRRLGTYAL